mmetsp:Transcript_17222/g.41365  ORF Transcript_17222/g.41365 Transcript_17222/m.41365 type:complete len:175 (-) Transcript_17222:1902-2426(-)
MLPVFDPHVHRYRLHGQFIAAAEAEQLIAAAQQAQQQQQQQPQPPAGPAPVADDQPIDQDQPWFGEMNQQQVQGLVDAAVQQLIHQPQEEERRIKRLVDITGKYSPVQGRGATMDNWQKKWHQGVLAVQGLQPRDKYFALMRALSVTVSVLKRPGRSFISINQRLRKAGANRVT